MASQVPGTSSQTPAPSNGDETQSSALPGGTPANSSRYPSPDEMWHRFGDMTFAQMRESIAVCGAAVFEDMTGWDIIFDNPDEILSIADPYVFVRGFSPSLKSFVHVLFVYRHWRSGWQVVGYGRWDDWVAEPQRTRGQVEGRRHIDASSVTVRFYGIVDWGGGVYSVPVRESIPGDIFAEEFIRLFHEHVGSSSWTLLNMRDMWFIGDDRLYVDLDGAVMNAQGSATGYAILVSLYNTLFSIPGVDEVVVLIDGHPEAMSDHIGFGHIARRDDPQTQTYLHMGRPRLSEYHAGVFAAVLRDEAPFVYMTYSISGHVDWVTGSVLSWLPFSGEPIYFSEYLDNAPYIFTYDIERAAIIDMDGSGVPEVVLASMWDGSSLILHYGGDGVVYGFGIPQRQFQALKEDGAFLQLSWMQDWGSIARVGFVRDGAGANMELEFLYEWEQVFEYYDGVHRLVVYLNGEAMNFEEGWPLVEAARARHHRRQYAIWYPFVDFLEILVV